jgi:nicotinate-nucleotide adenylyltransferase
MMQRLCFGGSFNPIHYGHLRCAAAVAQQARYDRVVLIPTGQPPHKPLDAHLAPATDRLAMCRLAIEQNPLFEVDDIEIHLPGPHYTVETAQELQRRGWPKVDWLIGADMARYLPNWHNPDRLLAEVHLVLMARPGWNFDWQSMPPKFRHLERQVVNAPLIDISSTEIRRRVAANESITDLTPPTVVDYIRTHNLYRA